MIRMTCLRLQQRQHVVGDIIRMRKEIGTLHKARNSWGVYDAYKALRKAKWGNVGRPLTEKEFYAIIRGINNVLADAASKGVTIEFPYHMGKLELRKFSRGASIVDGKLKVTYVPDWSKTWKLWELDPEEKKKKTIVRYENRWLFHIKYCKLCAEFKNRSFYQFSVNSFIRRNLSKNIKKGLVDTLW